MRLRSERIVGPGGVVAGEVTVEDGRIAAVGAVGSSTRCGEVVDLGANWLVPGFIDGHVHGGGGAQCNTADPDEVAAVARFHASHGTTGLVATTVAAPFDDLRVALTAIARCADSSGGVSVLGAHVEGPFLSRSQPGAMDPDAFLAPDVGVAEQLLSAGQGRVLMMTVAPELPGALELIASLVRSGVAVSVGHSEASFAETVAGVRAGASSATHVFNAMPAFDHRDPGVVGAVLDCADVSCELICDGVHLAPAALRLVLRAKGAAGVRLVTDAIEAAGMPDGEYRLGELVVTVLNGQARIAGGGSLAGSTMTMDAAVRNAVKFLGVGVGEAVAMASTNPARLLGLGDRKGAIAAGMDADLVALDDRLFVTGVMVGGGWVVAPGFL